MHGHRAEVSSVKWHTVISRWVTGSEDGTIRIWADTGEEEKVLKLLSDVNGVGDSFTLLMVGVVILEDLVTV